MEIIIGLILCVLALALLLYGAIFLVMGIAYAYWWLSIVVAHLLWILIAVGALVGFFCALRNAIKAARTVYKGK